MSKRTGRRMAPAEPAPRTEAAGPADHHRRVRAAPPPAKMQLNLTSMIDVIFLLLVYFVITANFAVGEGVVTARLPRPEATQAADQPPTQPLVIQIGSGGAMSAGYRLAVGPRQPEDFRSLQALLIEMQADPDAGRHGLFEPDNPVIIRPDGRVRWQHVVNAFNAAIAARYTNVRFAPAG